MFYHISHNGKVFPLYELFYVVSGVKTWRTFYCIDHTGMVFPLCETVYALLE